jgi:hypothetical protein
VSVADIAPAGPLHRALRALLDTIEGAFDRAFGQAGNPWRHLGGHLGRQRG